MLCLYAVALFVFFFFLDWISLRLRGDCDVVLNTNTILNAYKRNQHDKLRLSFDLFLENRSLREQALVIYAGAELVPKDKEARLDYMWVRITLARSPRKDGYFESTLVKPGKSIPLKIEILLEGRETVERLSHGSELALEVSYSYYGRKPMMTRHVRFSIPFASFQEKDIETCVPPVLSKVKTPENRSVFPIPTHLIFPGEDLSQVILQYTKRAFNPGDWVVLAETVVAIAQGRAYPVDSIQPGFWARRLNRFFQYDSSMASCYSMECAIREIGLPRMLLGIAVGLVGKVFGRSGDFYRIAGRAVASIDDCTGTLPPFDKSVVLGPKDANRAALDIQRKTGFEVAIVDANDLRKVDILGKTAGIVDHELTRLISDNPQGNADEQTPIVMIKRKNGDCP